MSVEKSVKEIRATGLLVVFAALCTALSAGIITAVAGSPKPNPGSAFQNAIVEFELAVNSREVQAVLSQPTEELARARRTQFNYLNYADYLFMVCYSALNATIFLYVAALNRSRFRERFVGNAFIRFGLLLSFLMLAGDALENVQLLRLTSMPEPEMSSTIKALIIFTRIKWGALFTAAILLGLAYASYSGRTGLLFVGFLYATAGSIGIMSLIVLSGRPLCEWGTLLLAVAWLVSAVHAGVRTFRRA
ncbi:MAG TPA: hypothetical protein PKE49_15140 [Leptospiraceae bacterium]|nr:hypothetical protein [Leptospirales bacterium]HMU82078.1 hypothetical protein [Leptospiraceae bacterium]HMX57860.1 hypothetical protein [Leptospiraceae bacterium]HNE21637.1 hypothetical protein [Leptospiraceae bacterium]HNJ05279.1 hypothetical protein [Leptospiraceae bacterium]